MQGRVYLKDPSILCRSCLPLAQVETNADMCIINTPLWDASELRIANSYSFNTLFGLENSSDAALEAVFS